MSLTPVNLLRPYFFEAGLWSYSGSVGTTIGEAATDAPENWHWGWESPTSELRGHILGHWLSAAAYLGVDDVEVKAKADYIVDELARCQRANGGQWVAAFPPAYLQRVTDHVKVWAPQYTIHKLLMGLWDMYAVAGNDQALDILSAFADWFIEWTSPYTREQLDDILDVETGGMLEIWADLYGLTKSPGHLQLLTRYDRPRFFDRLLAGEDVLTNRHANTQIPEILGAARAWEVTGEPRWREIVETFWAAAVTSRGVYCTGGSSSGEVWQPPFAITERLHSVQEHCTVYNMMRLADYLYRWTGKREYADYWERNLLNGIWAQQNRQSGMVAYFLSLTPDSQKRWGSRTNDFWCCHGSLLQSHSHLQTAVTQRTGDVLRISQFIPSTSDWSDINGTDVRITLTQDPLQGVVFGQTISQAGLDAIQRLSPELPPHRPEAMIFDIKVETTKAANFKLLIRLPGWLTDCPQASIDESPLEIDMSQEWITLDREWTHNTIKLQLPIGIRQLPAPGDASLTAFADGPYVLAGLASGAEPLPTANGNFRADEERTHNWWNAGTYRTMSNPSIRFIPLSDVIEQSYTVYFPTQEEAR
jgi:DUF1680 family protein